MRARGTEFLDIPNAYYTELKKRLASSKVQVKEDLEKLQKLKILIDYDEEGYLLQVRVEFNLRLLNPFLPYITLISVISLTDGAARILP